MIEQAVSFDSDVLKLAGAMTHPDGISRTPGVLMLPGSGQSDRDDNTKRLPINLFPQLVRAMDDIGFATFRYDKRGVGASDGDYWATGFNDRLTDAVAAITWFASQPIVDSSRIFVLGHSEGALLAIRLAAGAASMAGAVLLAGSAKTGEETLLWQGEQISKTLTGFSKWLVTSLRIDPLASQRKSLAKLKRTTGDVARVQLVQKINAKWMREFLAYDPSADLVKVHISVLAITGSDDIQVDPADLQRMAELVKGNFEYHVVPGVTHLLRADSSGSGLKTYKRQAAMPIDERVTAYICNWLLSRSAASG